ncbi:hypothetical protein HK405_001925, partial [Cladochytrium tenue]
MASEAPTSIMTSSAATASPFSDEMALGGPTHEGMAELRANPGEPSKPQDELDKQADFLAEVDRLRSQALTALNAIIAEIVTDQPGDTTALEVNGKRTANIADRRLKLGQLLTTLKINYSSLGTPEDWALLGQLDDITAESPVTPIEAGPSKAIPVIEEPGATNSAPTNQTSQQNETAEASASSSRRTSNTQASGAPTPRRRITRMTSVRAGAGTGEAEGEVSTAGNSNRRSWLLPKINRSSRRPSWQVSQFSAPVLPVGLPNDETTADATDEVRTNKLKSAFSATGGAHPDQRLAIVLAELCENLYKILDHPAEELLAVPNMAANLRSKSQEIRDAVDSEKGAGNTSNSMTSKWREIDQLSSLLVCLIEQRHRRALPTAGPQGSIFTELGPGTSVLPSHSHIDQGIVMGAGSVPCSSLSSGLRPLNELTGIIVALDRVVTKAPRMFNQTVELNERQLHAMDAAAVTGLVQRLMAGRENFEEQRAAFDEPSKLSKLVERIMAAGERSLNDQRSQITQQSADKIADSKLVKLMEQGLEWKSHETRLLEDLSVLYRDFSGDGTRGPGARMGQQRYAPTPEKERDIFLLGVLGRLDRMEQRLSNQVAVSTSSDKKLNDIEKILDQISSRGRLDDQ